jgi:serine/threonine protein phosphatase PrpC
MIINAHSYTNKGGRDNNEDFCCYKILDNTGVFVLADGLGGHNCGEVASKLAAEFILNEADKYQNYCEENLIEMMNDANSIIIRKQQENETHRDMRTTVVAGFIDNDTFSYFNVGDSRLYYFKKGCLYTQSRDHSVSQIAVTMGDITQEQVRFHDDRNKLLKVLGNDENLNIRKIDEAVSIESGDAFLLCSDGFWEYVYEVEMEADLIKSDSPKDWIEYMIKRLLLRVTGNNDNFTAIAGFIS